MVPRALQMLRKEHRTIAKLLDLFERQIALIDDGRESDTDLLKEIIEYFRTFPDVYHHPKEDLIVRFIARRDPQAAQPFEGLADEHEEGAVALAKLSRALTALLMDPAEHSKPFGALAAAFVADERRHMAWEDANLFDAAGAVLTEEDWREIDRRIDRLSMARTEVQARGRFERVDSELVQWRG